MVKLKRGFWIIALVIVMGSLVALTWSYGMFGDQFSDILLSFFETTAAPTESIPVQTLPPSTAPSTTVTEPVVTEPPVTETEPPATTVPPVTTEPTITISGLTAQQAVVADAATGQVLYCLSGETKKINPASVTKLFTAYVALQYLDPETHVTAGDELDFVGADSSKAYIRKGQSTSVETLIKGMLIPSGNDAAYILAAAAGRAIGGRSLTAAEAVQVFVDEMNAWARELGMNGTHFSNPDGYHSGSHYTCLEDLVTIGRVSLETPLIAETASKYSVRAELDDGTVRFWSNTNRMVNPNSDYYCEAVRGLKTGHTGNAGYCLLSAVRQPDGSYLIIGVFGCPGEYDRFTDTYILADLFGTI